MTEVKVDDYISDYLETDKHIIQLNNKLKEFKEVQKTRETNILTLIDKNCTNYELDGYLFRTKDLTNKESITLGYLEKTITEYYKTDLSTAEDLLNFIKINRKVETKHVLDIKKSNVK